MTGNEGMSQNGKMLQKSGITRQNVMFAAGEHVFVLHGHLKIVSLQNICLIFETNRNAL